jgi:hypothetical protein
MAVVISGKAGSLKLPRQPGGRSDYRSKLLRGFVIHCRSFIITKWQCEAQFAVQKS